MSDPLRSLRSVDNLINKLGKESGSIRAYHGSPYDFDRFDASKIGTGEGAQGYGYGLYFSGSPEVGEYYATAVSGLLNRPMPRVYEVEIGHPEEALLDWQQPIGRQSRLQQQVDDLRRQWGMSQRQFNAALRQELGGPWHPVRGRGINGSRLFNFLAGEMASPEDAASALLDVGIPGIRYIGAPPKNKTAAARNYVIFPGAEDQIRILRKRAVPASARREQ